MSYRQSLSSPEFGSTKCKSDSLSLLETRHFPSYWYAKDAKGRMKLYLYFLKGNKRWKHSGKMRCLFTGGKRLKLTLIVPESCTVQSSHYFDRILLALLALCVPPVQNVFVHTKTTTTELTVLFCSTPESCCVRACVCPPCNQYDYRGVSLPRQHLGIISVHMKLRAHAAWDHCPVNKYKPIKRPHCHFGMFLAPYIWLSGGHVMGECISMKCNQLEMYRSKTADSKVVGCNSCLLRIKTV